MSVDFFWTRMQRALMMDAINKELGKPQPHTREAMEWESAYKSTLSKNQLDKYNKEYAKLDKELEKW